MKRDITEIYEDTKTGKLSHVEAFREIAEGTKNQRLLERVLETENTVGEYDDRQTFAAQLIGLFVSGATEGARSCKG